MIRTIFAIFALFFSVAAMAQVPTCLPSDVPGGAGTKLVHNVTTNGEHWFYFCKEGGQYVLYNKVKSMEVTTPSLGDVITEAMKYPTPADALQAMWTMYDVQDPDATRRRLAVLEMYEAADVELLKLQPPVTYVVQKNSSYPDRPAYPFANGVRGKTATARAPILTGGEPTPCDPTVGVVEGSSRYYAFSSDKALVALCSAK